MSAASSGAGTSISKPATTSKQPKATPKTRRMGGVLTERMPSATYIEQNRSRLVMADGLAAASLA